MSITSSDKLLRAKVAELFAGPARRVSFNHPLYDILATEDGGEAIYVYEDPDVESYNIWAIREFIHEGVRFLSVEFNDYGGGSDPFFYYKVGSLPKGFLTRVAMAEAKREKETGLNRYGHARP